MLLLRARQAGDERARQPHAGDRERQPREPAGDALQRRVHRQVRRAPDAGSALGYDCIQLLAKAMKDANSAVPEDVARALHALKDWHGVTGALWPTKTATPPSPSASPSSTATAADFTGDGNPDLLLAGGAGWSTVPMAFMQGNSFSVANLQNADIPAWARTPNAKLLSGDVNGDHFADLLLTGGSGWSTIPVGFSNGNGTFTTASFNSPEFASLAQDPNAQAVAGDFNGDGLTDLALVGGTKWSTLPVAFSNGNGTFRITNLPMP